MPKSSKVRLVFAGYIYPMPPYETTSTSPPTPSGKRQPTLYEILQTSPTATPADLRLSYRICRLDQESDSAAKPEIRNAERAFNLLAHPDLRSCYDALLRDPGAPAVFPYGGFGQIVGSLVNSPRMKVPSSVAAAAALSARPTPTPVSGALAPN